jgi:hypothetical protein
MNDWRHYLMFSIWANCNAPLFLSFNPQQPMGIPKLGALQCALTSISLGIPESGRIAIRPTFVHKAMFYS